MAPKHCTKDASSPSSSPHQGPLRAPQANQVTHCLRINQTITTCPLTSTSGMVLMTLPAASTPLPREKPVPAAKPPTKWEQFAARRGIKPKTREQRRNLQYNAETGEWERKWGYKGANKAEETQWLVEVDPQKEAQREAGTSLRGDGRRERKERVKRNERKMRQNLRRAGRA